MRVPPSVKTVSVQLLGTDHTAFMAVNSQSRNGPCEQVVDSSFRTVLIVEFTISTDCFITVRKLLNSPGLSGRVFSRHFQMHRVHNRL